MKKFFANKSLLYPVLLILVFIILHLAFMWIGERYCFEQYSDSVAALFSGLAFVFLIISIQKQTESIDLQKQDLNLQLQEFKNSIEEQKKANEEFRKQNNALNMQIHESAYHRISLRSKDLLENIFIYNFDSNISLEEYFSFIIRHTYSESLKVIPIDNLDNQNFEFKDEVLNNFGEVFKRVYFNKGNQTLPYIRSLVLNTEILLINKESLGKLYTLYNADLRFSISAHACKFICFYYLWIDEGDLDLTNLVDELFLFAIFNDERSPVNNIIKDAIIDKKNYKKAFLKDE